MVSRDKREAEDLLHNLHEMDADELQEVAARYIKCWFNHTRRISRAADRNRKLEARAKLLDAVADAVRELSGCPICDQPHKSWCPLGKLDDADETTEEWKAS